jgi:hypothetical protein
VRSLFGRIYNKCKHFNGLSNKCCDKGVDYTTVGEGYQRKCFREFRDSLGRCEKEDFPTAEEAQAEADALVEKGKRDMNAMKSLICPECGDALIDGRIKSGAHKGHGRVWCGHCKKFMVMI